MVQEISRWKVGGITISNHFVSMCIGPAHMWVYTCWNRHAPLFVVGMGVCGVPAIVLVGLATGGVGG